jgi:hypothetical protein
MWSDKIKINLVEVGCKDMNLILLPRGMVQMGSFMNETNIFVPEKIGISSFKDIYLRFGGTYCFHLLT